MSIELINNPKPLTFCLVHGRYHDGWCWGRVMDELTAQGYDSIAPNLNTTDSKLSLDEHAKMVAEAEAASGAQAIIRVGWSWGANVIARQTESEKIKRLIFVAPAFHPATLEQWGDRYQSVTRTAAYLAMQKAMTVDPLRVLIESSDDIFYNDVLDPSLRLLAAVHLREHALRTEEPALPKFPDLPMDYIVTTNDKTLDPNSQRDIARMLGQNPVEIEAGHAVMLSRPIELARLLIELANQ